MYTLLCLLCDRVVLMLTGLNILTKQKLFNLPLHSVSYFELSSYAVCSGIKDV